MNWEKGKFNFYENLRQNQSDSRQNILLYFTRNPGLSFIAEKDNEIVGAVLGGHDGRRGFIHHLAGDSLLKTDIPGEVFVWRDILYEGPRNPGWPDNDTIKARARFLEQVTGGGLSREYIQDTLRKQYQKLECTAEYDLIVLWFDACLFDQSMLVHILSCLRFQGDLRVELLCIDAFTGISPFNGLGQLVPGQLASIYDKRQVVTSDQFEFATEVDRAFALQDQSAFVELANLDSPPFPWVPAAVARWLQELPDPETGLGRLEQLALDAILAGCETPAEIFREVAATDTHPQYWGDTTLWGKLNSLADRNPPFLLIDGPAPRLPQWAGTGELNGFRITILPN